jgi:nucleotide-binding universal stress UspA family protein
MDSSGWSMNMKERSRKPVYELLQADHYTPRELAELLEIGEHTVQNAVFEGELPALVVDHDIISIRRDDVVVWFNQRYGSLWPQRLKVQEMFETVIVPLDGTAHAEFALPFAVDEARLHATTLVLIRVIPRPEPCSTTYRKSGPLAWQGEWPFEDLEPAKSDASRYLREVVTRFGLDSGTELIVAVGDPAVRVTMEAQRHQKPLVVMLTGDCTREACPPLSLVASYLMIAGAIPVLGLRQPPPEHLSAPNGADSPQAWSRRTRPGPALVPSPQASGPGEVTSAERHR